LIKFIYKLKGSNNSSTSRNSISQQGQLPKPMMASVSTPQKINPSINAPQNKSPNMLPKMASINEDSHKLVRINSIGMNNMIRINQSLKSNV